MKLKRHNLDAVSRRLKISRERIDELRKEAKDKMLKYQDSQAPQYPALARIVPWDNESIIATANRRINTKYLVPKRRDSKGNISYLKKPFHMIMSDYTSKLMKNTIEDLGVLYVPGLCTLYKEEINKNDLSDKFMLYDGEGGMKGVDPFNWEPIYKVSTSRVGFESMLRLFVQFGTKFFPTKPTKQLRLDMKKAHPEGKYYPLTNKNVKWRV